MFTLIHEQQTVDIKLDNAGIHVYTSVLEEQLERILTIVLIVCSLAAAAVLTAVIILVVKIRRMTEWKVRNVINWVTELL